MIICAADYEKVRYSSAGTAGSCQDFFLARRGIEFHREINIILDVDIQTTLDDFILFNFVQTLDKSMIFHLDVSKNSGTPKSSILIGFSIINHPFCGVPLFLETPP